MTIDDAMLIAYIDGELGPLDAKRVERAVMADPALGERLARHRLLRDRVGRAFAPIAAEPVPDRLTALLTTNVVPLVPRRTPGKRWWPVGAIAAAIALTIGLGTPGGRAPAVGDLASGALDDALDRQLAANSGDPRMIVSFRRRTGGYCRTFLGREGDGIACREPEGWRLVRLTPGGESTSSTYRQAGSSSAATLAAAQAMMAGEPLDAGEEERARQRGWR